MWVDDPHFNPSFHVRHTALPHPGGDEELKRLAGRVFSQSLDRSRPLWELWLVEGLEGERFALLSKTHHAARGRHLGRRHRNGAVGHLVQSSSGRPTRARVDSAAAAVRRATVGRRVDGAGHRPNGICAGSPGRTARAATTRRATSAHSPALSCSGVGCSLEARDIGRRREARDLDLRRLTYTSFPRPRGVGNHAEA